MPAPRLLVLRITLALACALLGASARAEELDGGGDGETVVTALRLARPVRDVPSTVIVVPRQELERSPASTPDNLLRTVPSAATFRRSSSLVADPSSQGLNLRGLGPSGVSRALVLQDGLPLNDPFGGWVYWGSISRLDVDRIEIAPTGASALYGNFALGGVVDVVSRPLAPALDADLQAGSFGLFDAAVRGASKADALGLEVDGEYLRTDGYDQVLPSERGPIDRPSSSERGVVGARAELELAPGVTAAARLRHFDEDENGGTRFTTAGAHTTTYGATLHDDAPSGATLDLALFAGTQEFDQQRARVAAGRVDESLAGVQAVPADDQGLGVTWSAPRLEAAGQHTLSVGADALRIHGVSNESLVPATASPQATVQRSAGGEQLFAGAFVQDAARLAPWLDLTAAARLDLFRNHAGHLDGLTRAGVARTTAFDDTDAAQLDPKLSVLLRPSDLASVRASVYRAFRAPTMNELYRPFQVGTVLTDANPELRAETMWGAEAGPELTLGGAVVRAAAFWNTLDAPITNVTLPAALPDGATRLRENLGRARVRGAELELDWRIARAWSAVVAYTFVDATVASAPGQPTLIGKRLPQDPEHRGTAELTFDDPKLGTVTVDARLFGPQFEDDQNQLPMAGALVVDVAASRRLVGGLAIFAAVENLLDRQYLVGRSGVDTVGQPLTARAGLRLRADP